MKTLSSSENKLERSCLNCRWEDTAAGRERREMEVGAVFDILEDTGNMVDDGWKRDANSGEAVEVGEREADGRRGSDLEFCTEELLFNPSLRMLCRLQPRAKPTRTKFLQKRCKYKLNKYSQLTNDKTAQNCKT